MSCIFCQPVTSTHMCLLVTGWQKMQDIKMMDQVTRCAVQELWKEDMQMKDKIGINDIYYVWI